MTILELRLKIIVDVVSATSSKAASQRSCTHQPCVRHPTTVCRTAEGVVLLIRETLNGKFLSL